MRLTKYQIDIIIARVMKETFDKRNEDLLKEESKIGMLAYNEAVIISIRNLTKKFPKNWLRTNDRVDFNVGGQRHRLRVKASVAVLHFDENGYLGVIAGDLGNQITKLAEDKYAYQTERAATDFKLRTMLSSVSTFKKLKELWPEGLKFYKDGLLLMQPRYRDHKFVLVKARPWHGDGRNNGTARHRNDCS
jgi:hypothetical protein